MLSMIIGCVIGLIIGYGIPAIIALLVGRLAKGWGFVWRMLLVIGIYCVARFAVASMATVVGLGLGMTLI